MEAGAALTSPPVRDATRFSLEAAGLDLARTLSCGQAFRWSRRDGLFEGVVGRSLWRIRPRRFRMQVEVTGERVRPERVRRYLLGWGPLQPLEARLCGDPVLARVLHYTRGISILAQDPWEVLATFLVSQNNNVPKIARSVAHLCRALGEPVCNPPLAWTFPDPARVAEAPDALLREALLGYRAPYLRWVARRVACGELDWKALRRLRTEDAQQVLLGLPGVGEKVADCVLLFGLGHRRVFPVDVWVHRAVEALYFGGKAASRRAVRAWALERFGDVSGLAQQHLYHYARTVLRPTLKEPGRAALASSTQGSRGAGT